MDANQQPTGQLKLRVAPADAAMLAASVAHRLVEPQAMDQAVLSFSEAAAAHPTDDLSVTDAVDDAALLVSRLPSEARREHSLRHFPIPYNPPNATRRCHSKHHASAT